MPKKQFVVMNKKQAKSFTILIKEKGDSTLKMVDCN